MCGKIGIPQTGLTIPVGRLSLLQQTVLSRSAIVVLSRFLVASLCCSIAFCVFCWCRGFCQMSEPYLFLFRFSKLVTAYD